MVVLTAVVAVGLAAVPAGIGAAPVEPLRLNDFQAKGSHNSFHSDSS